MSQSKRKLFSALLVFVVLAMASLACGGPSNTVSDVVPANPTPTQEEADVYWAEENEKAEVRKEAIRRDAVVVEWRGNWDPSAHLALFRGQSHVSDVVVGSQYLDLVQRDQIMLKEYDGDNWFAIASVSNNLEPGGKIVFVR